MFKIGNKALSPQSRIRDILVKQKTSNYNFLRECTRFNPPTTGKEVAVDLGPAGGMYLWEVGDRLLLPVWPVKTLSLETVPNTVLGC